MEEWNDEVWWQARMPGRACVVRSIPLFQDFMIP